jgi:hypothetical protein
MPRIKTRRKNRVVKNNKNFSFTLWIVSKDSNLYNWPYMTQQELVRRLEEHFRKEEQTLMEQREQVHEQQQQLSDEEWWQRVIADTVSIRPEMLQVFERNKEQMIANRFKTLSSELDFREKIIRSRVMELLPFVSALRKEQDSVGELTDEQIQQASVNMELANIKAMSATMEASVDKQTDPRKRMILEQLTANAKEDLIDLETMSDLSTATQEQVSTVGDNIAGRLHQLAEWMKNPNDKN